MSRSTRRRSAVECREHTQPNVKCHRNGKRQQKAIHDFVYFDIVSSAFLLFGSNFLSRAATTINCRWLLFHHLKTPFPLISLLFRFLSFFFFCFFQIFVFLFIFCVTDFSVMSTSRRQPKQFQMLTLIYAVIAMRMVLRIFN